MCQEDQIGSILQARLRPLELGAGVQRWQYAFPDDWLSNMPLQSELSIQASYCTNGDFHQSISRIETRRQPGIFDNNPWTRLRYGNS